MRRLFDRVACGTKSAKNKTSHESGSGTVRDFRRRRLDVTNARGVVETSDSEEEASEASEASSFFPSSTFPSSPPSSSAAVPTVSREDGFFSPPENTGFASTATDAGARAAWGGVRGLRIFVFRLGSVYTTGLCLCLSARRGVEVGGGSDPADVWTFFFPRVGGLVASPGVAVSRAAKPRRFTRGAPLVAGGGIVGSVFFGD
jgi:hypothetical protein